MLLDDLDFNMVCSPMGVVRMSKKRPRIGSPLIRRVNRFLAEWKQDDVLTFKLRGWECDRAEQIAGAILDLGWCVSVTHSPVSGAYRRQEPKFLADGWVEIQVWPHWIMSPVDGRPLFSEITSPVENEYDVMTYDEIREDLNNMIDYARLQLDPCSVDAKDYESEEDAEATFEFEHQLALARRRVRERQRRAEKRAKKISMQKSNSVVESVTDYDNHQHALARRRERDRKRRAEKRAKKISMQKQDTGYDIYSLSLIDKDDKADRLAARRVRDRSRREANRHKLTAKKRK